MKKLFVVSVLVLLALALAACGQSSVQPVADQAVSATPTAVAHQQTIEVAVQATLTAVAPTLTPPPPPSATPVVTTITSPADVPRITAQELKAKLDAGQAVVFDARRRESYIERHIAEAISLPQSRVAARLVELPTDKLAVFYCT
jgi:predicted small lipoprotein YifL